MRCSLSSVHHKNSPRPGTTLACLESGFAQAQESTAHEPSAAENDPSALADLQATIVEGAAKRLRPKFMTVATMFVGLIPIM